MMQKRRAFTLLELIIVIGILAVLAGAVFTSINPQARLIDAKETKAITDAEAYGKAINLYLADRSYNPSLPPLIESGTGPSAFAFSASSGTVAICEYGFEPDGSCISLDALVPQYLPALPKIPEAPPGDSGYLYSYTDDRGTYGGAVLPSPSYVSGGTQTPPPSVSALSFSESDANDVLRIDDAQYTFPGMRFSYSLWVRPRADGFQGMVDNFVYQGGNHVLLRGYRVGLMSYKPYFSLLDWEQNDGVLLNQAALSIQSSQSLPLGEWAHVVVTYDGNEPNMSLRAKMYVNGMLVGDVPVVNGVLQNTAAPAGTPLFLGTAHNFPYPGYDYLTGDMDEVRAYDDVLSAADALALSDDEPSNDRSANLVGHWGMNEGAGTVAANEAGGTDAQFMNTPVWLPSPEAAVPY